MPSIPMSRTLLATALSAAVGLAGTGCGDTGTGTGWADRYVPDRCALDN